MCPITITNNDVGALMDPWKVSNMDVTLKELMEAIGLWKLGGC